MIIFKPSSFFNIFVLLFALTKSQSPKCPFSNTIDLATATKHSNGSYTYEGLLISPAWIDEYDEDLQNGELLKVPKHQRACVCQGKPCVNLCCANPNAKLNPETAECLIESEAFIGTPRTNVIVQNDTGISTTKYVGKDFTSLYGLPCKDAIPYLPEDNEWDLWHLNENGSIGAKDHQLALGKYCLHPDLASKSSDYAYKLYGCPMPNRLTAVQIAVTCTMAVSALCMVVTIAVYLLMGKRTEHHILFMCYLIALSVSYLIVVTNNFFIVPIGVCYAMGYIGYFTVMASFCLLTVICTSMWNNFRSSNFYASHTKTKRRLKVCLLSAFGGAALLTSVIVLAQLSSLDEDAKPNIGMYTCWISTQKGYSAYIYLYGPMIVLIVTNMVMFVLTSMRIYSLKKDVNRAQISKNYQSVERKLSFGKEFSLYLRVFFTMGIYWILEIVSYTLKEDSFITTLSDFINGALGIIMLLLFGNSQLLYKRFFCARKCDSESSCTQTSEVRQTSSAHAASTKKLLRDEKV